MISKHGPLTILAAVLGIILKFFSILFNMTFEVSHLLGNLQLSSLGYGEVFPIKVNLELLNQTKNRPGISNEFCNQNFRQI